MTETEISIQEHYADALHRGDVARAERWAGYFFRLTGRMVSSDPTDPEPGYSDNPGAWYAWRHREMMRAPVIV